MMIQARAYFFLIVLTLVGCAEKPAPQESCNFVQNNQLQRVSWKSNVPINIYAHETFPAEHLTALRMAFKHWEDKMGRALFKEAGTHGGPNLAKRDGVSAIYWMTDWEAEKRSEQARTTIYWEGTQIKEADVKLNAKDFPDMASEVPLTGGQIDLPSLIAHELGHVLGLQHIQSVESVMAVILGYLEVRREPFPIDVASLKCEY